MSGQDAIGKEATASLICGSLHLNSRQTWTFFFFHQDYLNKCLQPSHFHKGDKSAIQLASIKTFIQDISTKGVIVLENMTHLHILFSDVLYLHKKIHAK